MSIYGYLWLLPKIREKLLVHSSTVVRSDEEKSFIRLD